MAGRKPDIFLITPHLLGKHLLLCLSKALIEFPGSSLTVLNWGDILPLEMTSAGAELIFQPYVLILLTSR